MGGDLAFVVSQDVEEREKGKEGRRGDGYLYGFFSAYKIAVPRVVCVYPPSRDKLIVIVIKRARTRATHSGSWDAKRWAGDEEAELRQGNSGDR